MLINEINLTTLARTMYTLPKNTKAGVFVEYLKTKYGFSEINEGAYSIVLSNPNISFVVKISGDDAIGSDFVSVRDNAWLYFHNLVMSVPVHLQKHFPKMSRRVKFKGKLESWYFVLIEKLESIESLFQNSMAIGEFTKKLDLVDDPEYFLSLFVDFYDGHYDDEFIEYLDHILKYTPEFKVRTSKFKVDITDGFLNDLQKLPPSFIEALFYVIENSGDPTEGWRVDLHFGNYMIRKKTGEIVITDPYSI